MKKIFKILSVALVAVATFVSAGCSCSLNDKKAVEKVRALNSSSVYKTGTEYKDFTLTYIHHKVFNQSVTPGEAVCDAPSVEGKTPFCKTVVDTNFADPEFKFTITKYHTDEKQSEERIGTDIAENAEVNGYYDRFKTQPLNSYGTMTDGKYNMLFGLAHADSKYLLHENISTTAKKAWFKDEVTFTIEYDVALRERYRQTIVINGDNKITSAKLELVGTYTTNLKGDTKTEVFTIYELFVQYK